jgi:hypothetical protein
MRLLRGNLEWMAARALGAVKEDDLRHGPEFKSGHQQQLEDVLACIKNGEHIIVVQGD